MHIRIIKVRSTQSLKIRSQKIDRDHLRVHEVREKDGSEVLEEASAISVAASG